MTFSLNINRDAFDTNARTVIENFGEHGASVTAVIKGNGYGFGRDFLARESERLGISRIAVGTVYELGQALREFPGDVVVLEPFEAKDEAASNAWRDALGSSASRAIAVLSGDDIAAARNVGISKALLKGRTSMNRFGLGLSEIVALLNADHHGVDVLGVSLHLPMRDFSTPVAEVSKWIDALTPHAESRPEFELALSHVGYGDVENIIDLAGPAFTVTVRVGTSLWLGAPSSALVARGTVLEIRDDLQSTDRVGYRQVPVARGARLLVISGGTSHGVALAAPAVTKGMRNKLAALYKTFSEISGRYRSPFRLGGANLYFAEPPHMHQSLVWTTDPSVRVGDEIECVIRKTTATFDAVNFH